MCVYARLCGQIQHQSTPRLAGWLASEGSSLFTATTPVMRCSEQRGRTTGILMATVRREDMCWGEKTTTHRQKKDLGVVWKRRLVLQRTVSGPLKKAPVCRRPLLRSRVLFIYLFIFCSTLRNLKLIKTHEDALTSGPLCPLWVRRYAPRALPRPRWLHLHWWVLWASLLSVNEAVN